MDIEQLKLILQTVQGVSSGALTVTIIFFLKGFLETLLGYGIVVYIAKNIASLSRDAILKSAFHNRLMDEINTSVYLNFEEQTRIVKLVRKGKAAEAAEATGRKSPNEHSPANVGNTPRSEGQNSTINLANSLIVPPVKSEKTKPKKVP